MPLINIVNYQAAWDLDGHRGIIKFQLANGQWSSEKVFANPAEFSAVVDLLRNEKPVYHRTGYDTIQTGPEQIGEKE